MSLSAEELLKLVQEAQANYQAGSNVSSTQQPIAVSYQPSTTTMSSLPSIDVSLLDPQVLHQVRSEYLAQQQVPTPVSTSDNARNNTKIDQKEEEDDSNVESAKSITPEVLVKLSKLAKETDLLDVLRNMRQEQHDRERELWRRREDISKRLNAKRDHVLARELIGIDVKKEMEAVEKNIAAELRTFDQSIIKDMDRQKRRQEERLKELHVPFFRSSTDDPTIVKLQSRVFKILLDMLDD
ncbi:hypothetical protein BGW37DRAFT_231267 [Umbelopsis sp. PMI_123]|nr:hypothetical protein BGW37DRAFT_231267 [Umbelopsis sp. PMI_123]